MNRYKPLSACLLMSLTLFTGLPGRSLSQNGISLGQETSHTGQMQEDPHLQTRINFDMNAKPLRVVLAAITQQTGTPIRAEANLQEFRVSLHTIAQPLATVMQRLAVLFEHGGMNKDYGWTRTLEAGVPHYVLSRNARAYEQERAMLDLPRTRRIQWLKQIREFTHLPAFKRKTFHSDCPCLQYCIKTGNGFDTNPGAEAIAAMTDEQMTALLRDGQVEVPQLALSAEALAYLQSAAASDNTLTRSKNDESLPSHARLTLEDDSKQSAQLRGVSSLSLDFGSGFLRHCPMSFAFDTLGQLPDDAPVVPNDDKALPQINLLAHESALPGQHPKIVLSAALRLLAREAAINLYAEVFPKSPRVLLRTTGTKEGLLSSICHTYGCEWHKINGDYVVYSKAWAQDRAADIPQPFLDHWSSSYLQHHRYELQDLIEMACLKEEQQETITDVLEVQVSLRSANRLALQMLALISPHDIAKAYTPQGFMLDNLDETSLLIAQQLFHSKTIFLPITVQLKYRREVDHTSVRAGTNIELTDSAGAKANAWAFDYSQ